MKAIRKTYKPPLLVIYGKLRELTAGGSQTGTEVQPPKGDPRTMA